MSFRLRTFLAELKRRKVYRAAAAYVAASIAVLGAAEVILDPLGLQALRGPIVVIVLLGFPVALILSWAYDVRPELPAPQAPDDGQASGPSEPSSDQRPGGVAEPDWQSVAVLPFENFSSDEEQEYFSAGLTEEILHELTKIEDLKVSARTSTFALRRASLDIRAIAERLGVANVLEGSVRRSGDHVRITAQLVEAKTGFHLWSETYDRELSDVFEIQTAIAQAVADHLRVTLVEPGDGSGSGSRNAEAHEAYLRGRFLWNQRTPRSIRAAIEEFTRATGADPEYAEAYSGLADSYAVLDRYVLMTGDPTDLGPIYAQALGAARKAVELAPRLGPARASLGFANAKVGNWDEAERAFRLALELTPGYAPAQQWYGLFLGDTGRSEKGLPYAGQAVELDPVSPVVRITLVDLLQRLWRWHESVAEARKAIPMDPTWFTVWSYLAVGLLNLEEYDEAVEAMLESARLRGVADLDAARRAFEGIVTYHKTGEPQAIDWEDATPQYFRLTGQRELALAAFERVVRAGALEFAAGQHVSGLGAFLGDDPRYQALLKEAGITW